MTLASEEVGRRYAGKVALITGASRGIGLAIAERIVGEGGRVTITGRRREGLEPAVARLGDELALAVVGSADDIDHQAETIEATLSRFGRIDLLVNNTGINPAYGLLLDADVAALAKIMEVNVLAAISWTRQVHRAWLAANGGAVVNVASVAGQRPAAGIGFYGASKAALIHVTAQLAAELAPAVRVNAVAPAVIRTVFASALYEGREEEVAAGYPLGRLGVPEDVAAAVAYLGSGEASWITGQALRIDGGLTLGGGV